jgi:hypothetical protein
MSVLAMVSSLCGALLLFVLGSLETIDAFAIVLGLKDAHLVGGPGLEATFWPGDLKSTAARRFSTYLVTKQQKCAHSVPFHSQVVEEGFEPQTAGLRA